MKTNGVWLLFLSKFLLNDVNQNLFSKIDNYFSTYYETTRFGKIAGGLNYHLKQPVLHKTISDSSTISIFLIRVTV